MFVKWGPGRLINIEAKKTNMLLSLEKTAAPDNGSDEGIINWLPPSIFYQQG